MATCSNCFNGCTDIVSDQCVRYTGATNSTLGISNGDTQIAVTNKITEFLLAILAGTGIKFDLSAEGEMCAIIQDELTACCGEITLADITQAMVKAICSLSTDVETLKTFKDMISASYDIGCLDLEEEYTIHDLIQALIDKVCSTSEAFNTLAQSIADTYVRQDELSELIGNYLSDNPITSMMKDKMVPYTAVEYYGPLTQFDISGAGTGDWDRIFLCNGNNGTPDKRGRIPVGAVNGMGGPALSETVNPAVAGNPNYGLATLAGANLVNLAVNNLPAHDHPASGTLSANPHSHFNVANGAVQDLSSNNYTVKNRDAGGSDDDYNLYGTNTPANLGKTSEATITGTVAVTVSATGGGLPHSNIPPVISCYYIIYLPA